MGLAVSAGGAASGAMASLTGAPSELNEGDAIGRREPDFPKPAHPARRPRSRRRGGRTNERRRDSSFQGLGNWPAWFTSPRQNFAGREFELARGDKQSHQRERRSNTPGLHFERARRRREERDPFGWIRDHPRGTKAWHRSVLHVEARDRALPSETNFLFPRRGEVKALGREESGDEGYAAPNPARTRRGSVRCDRRSRYGRVLAPIARRNAARFTRSRPAQPRPSPLRPAQGCGQI